MTPMWINKVPHKKVFHEHSELSTIVQLVFKQFMCSHGNPWSTLRAYIKFFVREWASVMPGNSFWRPFNYQMSVVGLGESLVARCAALTSFWPHAEVRESKRSHRQTDDCQVLHLDLSLNLWLPPSCVPLLLQSEDIKRLLAVQPW